MAKTLRRQPRYTPRLLQNRAGQAKSCSLASSPRNANESRQERLGMDARVSKGRLGPSYCTWRHQNRKSWESPSQTQVRKGRLAQTLHDAARYDGAIGTCRHEADGRAYEGDPSPRAQRLLNT